MHYTFASLCFVLLFGLQSCSERSVSVERVESGINRFDGISYYLTKGIVSLTISRPPVLNKDGVFLRLDNEILTINGVEYLPDPEHQYAVQINHNPWYDDDIAITVDSNGLLAAINSTVTDRTPDVIRTIAQAPIKILSEPEIQFFNVAPGPPAKAGECMERPFRIEAKLDPTDPSERTRLNQFLSGIYGKNCDDRKIEFRATPLSRIVGGTYGRHPDCNIDPCFRTAMPHALELWTSPLKNKKNARVVSRTVAVLPNKHVIGQIALTRAPFVQKHMELKFTNGMLTYVKLDNPSEVLAAIQLPIDVAQAIIAIPTALFDFTVRSVNADNRLLTAQRENLDLQRQIIETQRNLVLAQTAAN